jgi:DNA-damage-inducible protein J
MATKPQTVSTAKRQAKSLQKAPAVRKRVKSGSINARIEAKLKRSAEAVLDRIGLSTADALTIFFEQVVAKKGMPFKVKIPNRETIKAMRELDEGGGTRHTGDAASVFAALLRPRSSKS